MKLHFALPVLLIATLQFALSPSLRAGVVTFNTGNNDLACTLGGSEAPQYTDCKSDAAIDNPGVYGGIGLYLKSSETSAGDYSSGYSPDTFSVTLTDTGTIGGSISVSTPVYLSYDNLGLSVDNDGYITQYAVTYTLADTSAYHNPTVVTWTDTVNESGDPDSLPGLSGGGVALTTYGLSSGDRYELTETVTMSYVVPGHRGDDDNYVGGGGTQATIAIGDSLTLSTVAPEPASFVLAGVALAGLGWLRRKRA
ncbi:MAG: PEP-CTERM sorting domain-containing protein [Bryobacteraceae bacterium]|jgi:hypothetical protein